MTLDIATTFTSWVVQIEVAKGLSLFADRRAGKRLYDRADIKRVTLGYIRVCRLLLPMENIGIAMTGKAEALHYEVIGVPMKNATTFTLWTK